MTGDVPGTDTSDSTYDLVSVLYHCLQGAEMYEVYAVDAEDDEELARFFEEIAQQDRDRALRAKQLLAPRLNQS